MKPDLTGDGDLVRPTIHVRVGEDALAAWEAAMLEITSRLEAARKKKQQPPNQDKPQT